MIDDARRRIGRYELGETIAKGGMAQIHLGRQRGDVGFTRTVAIKRLHGEFAAEPEFVSMLIDEARLASRIDHPNVVSPSDVVAAEGEVCIVMPLVSGLSLSRLLACAARAGMPPSPGIAGRIISDVLLGLHAAHEARSENGDLLDLIHRDVSPQNAMVGRDGITRVIDFGIAMANARWQTTRQGQIKGKLPYMAREQLLEGAVDRRVDVYAAGITLWEMLVGKRPFEAKSDAALFGKVLEGSISPPHLVRPDLAEAWSALVMKAVAREQDDRYPTALAFHQALEAAGLLCDRSEIVRWVELVAHDELRAQRDLVSRFEREGQGASRDSTPLIQKAFIAEQALTTPETALPWRSGGQGEERPAASPEGQQPRAPEALNTAPAEVAASVSALKPDARRRTIFVIGAGVLLAMTLAFAFISASGPEEGASSLSQDSKPVGATPVAPTDTSLPKPAPSEPAQPARAPDTPSASPTPIESGKSSLVAKEAPAPGAPSPRSAPAPTTVKPRAVATPKSLDCSKPYTIGSDGIRRVRRECLNK